MGAAKRRFEVHWTAPAASDLDAILEHISVDNPENALRLLNRFKKKALTLNNLPGRGRIVPELREHGITIYRELILAPWRILYRVSETTVHVLAVVDSRSRMEDLLLDRLTREG